MRRPFQVFVNGIAKREGVDFVVAGDELVFPDVLIPPRRMTAKTYARLMFFGRYKPEHTVDVAYQRDGRPAVASGLEIRPPAGGQASG